MTSSLPGGQPAAVGPVPVADVDVAASVVVSVAADDVVVVLGSVVVPVSVVLVDVVAVELELDDDVEGRGWCDRLDEALVVDELDDEVAVVLEELEASWVDDVGTSGAEEP